MVAPATPTMATSSTSTSATDDYPIVEMRTHKKMLQHSPTTPTKQVVPVEEHEGTGRPILSQLLGGLGKRKHLPRARIGSEDEILKKNRRVIGNYLRRLGALMGKDVSLNEEGMSFFSYRKFVVVVEVPVENNQNVYIYTMVCRVLDTDDRPSVLQKAMELNYMQYRTRGSTLGLDGEEVNLCYTVAISGLAFGSLKAAMEDFLLTAIETNIQLDEAKRRPGVSENPIKKDNVLTRLFG
jgi:Tir chaperone protein (CesT) family